MVIGGVVADDGTPRLVGLVADDLTGATDAAVQFAAVGWSAYLLRKLDAQPERVGATPALLALATGVRAEGDAEAADRTARAVESLLARGCDRLYVKIDSTMRGSVAGQVRGALAAWSQAHPRATGVLCPAFPGQGRTVVGGHVLVDGVPLTRTAAATDPVTPVTESRLDRLVPEGVAYADAADDDDLAEIAAGLDRLGPRAVAVGSAGLAGALARHWSPGSTPSTPAVAPSPRILVGVSSLHPAAREALDRLRRALADRAHSSPGAVDVVTPPAAPADAATAAAWFGDGVAERIAKGSYDALVLVGGDGAAAALDRIGADAIAVHTALAPGVPLGTIVGGAAHGVRVVTKSGGFGRADSLVRIIDDLQLARSYGREQP